jgi:hypothetical protein|tara:strand:- start:173 stop:412 length:240 start_codon:yes stop_codon:yes gene_type:complete
MAYTNAYNVLKPVETTVQGIRTIKFIPEECFLELTDIETITPYWNPVLGEWDRTKTTAYFNSGNVLILDTDFDDFGQHL